MEAFFECRSRWVRRLSCSRVKVRYSRWVCVIHSRLVIRVCFTLLGHPFERRQLCYSGACGRRVSKDLDRLFHPELSLHPGRNVRQGFRFAQGLGPCSLSSLPLFSSMSCEHESSLHTRGMATRRLTPVRIVATRLGLQYWYHGGTACGMLQYCRLEAAIM